MPEILRRQKLLLTVLGLVLLAGQLMSSSIDNDKLPRMGSVVISAVLSPLEVIHHELTLSVRRVWQHYIWLQGVEEERNSLSVRMKEIEAQNSKLIEFEEENRRLKDLLNFRERTSSNGVLATIVGRDPSNWVKTVTINRGTEDGLRPGLAVVDGNAVVGQTISVNQYSAKILLLSDNTSAIDAIVQNSRAQGTVEGAFEKKLFLRYVLREYPVSPGDRVVASGLDGVYPKGTLIGVVTTVEPANNGLFQNIELQPSTDLNRLETVLVLLPGEASKSAPQQGAQ